MSKVMTLKATSETYVFEDPSGYKFTVYANYDPEWGWSASVSMNADGMKTSQGAIQFLKYPVRQFLKQLAETFPEEE